MSEQTLQEFRFYTLDDDDGPQSAPEAQSGKKSSSRECLTNERHDDQPDTSGETDTSPTLDSQQEQNGSAEPLSLVGPETEEEDPVDTNWFWFPFLVAFIAWMCLKSGEYEYQKFG
jgi:hypothetical protein